MTERRDILRGIVCNGDSIVEACENADIAKLREEGEGKLADMIEQLDRLAQQFAEEIGVFDEALNEEIIAEDEPEEEDK